MHAYWYFQEKWYFELILLCWRFSTGSVLGQEKVKPSFRPLTRSTLTCLYCLCRNLNPYVVDALRSSALQQVAIGRQAMSTAREALVTAMSAGISAFAFQVGPCRGDQHPSE